MLPCNAILTLLHLRDLFLHSILPIGKLFLCFILGNAMRPPNLADKIIALPGNDVELVIGELAPPNFDIALERFPVTLVRTQFTFITP